MRVRVPQVVRGEPPAGMGAGLHFVEGVGGGAGEELPEEEAMWREDRADDGEVSRSPNSISVKYNPVNTPMQKKGRKQKWKKTHHKPPRDTHLN